MTLLDRILAETSLFENLNLTSENDLINALKIANDKIAGKIATSGDLLQKKKLNELEALINDEILKAYGGVFESVTKEAVESASISYNLMVGSLGSTIPISIANEIANSNRKIKMSENNSYQFKELFQLKSEAHARRLRNVISAGVVPGYSVDKIIREYNIVSDKLTKANIRTNVNTVIGQARETSKVSSFGKLEKMGIIKGYEYSSVFDSQTSDYCIRMSRKRFFKKISEISHLIKVHGNCRSEWLPITDDDKENERASQFGATTESDYKSWFKTTPDYFKRAKLTKKQYEAYNKGLFEVGSLTDFTKKMTLAEVKALSNRLIKD